MKAKEYIIQKLVELGKKYRWMKYPMLAAVSLISLIFLALEKCLERPRRAVIALVCLVLIISQSWYLISVANDPEYPESAGNVEGIVTVEGDSEPLDVAAPADSESLDDGIVAIDETYETFIIRYYFKDGDEVGHNLPVQSTVYIKDGQFYVSGSDTVFEIPSSEVTVKAEWQECFSFKGWSTGGVEIANAADLYDKLNSGAISWKSNGSSSRYLILNPEWNREGYKITYYRGLEATSGTEFYKVVKSGQPVEIAQLPTSFTKTGYTFNTGMWNVIYPGGNEKNPIDHLVPGEVITFEDYSYSKDINLFPEWIPNNYTIHFIKGSTEVQADGDVFDENRVQGSMADILATYDREISLPTCDYTWEGYSFVGWVNESGILIPAADIAKGYKVENLTEQPNGEYSFTAKWVYRDGELNEDSLEYQYLDDVDQIIYAYRKGVRSDNFQVKVLSVSGDTIDGPITSLSEFRSITGLEIYDAVEGLAKDSIWLKGTVKTVSNGPIQLNIELYDSFNDKTTYPTLLIYLNKRELEVTGVQYVTKEYDGTTQIGIGEIYFGNAQGADVFLNNASQSGSFADANVGVDKVIKIEDIYIIDKGGMDASRYFSVPNPAYVYHGSITPKDVNVTPIPIYENGRDYILTGQTPTFGVEVNDADIPTAVFDVDKKLIVDAILADQKNFTSSYGPSNNYQPGTNHTIGINVEKVSPKLPNYTLVVNSGSLVVKQESVGVYGYRYQIKGSKFIETNKWWYDVAPSIFAIKSEESNSIYDSVYVFVNADDKKYTYDAAFRKDGAPVSEELAKNGNVYIQLGDSDSKAVTAPELIDMFVDLTAPVIDEDNIDVSTVNSGTMSRLGNMLSFGNFFKEEVILTIPVTDNLSGLGALTYYKDGAYFDSGSAASIANGKASIRLPLNFDGTLTLVAMDQAGNVGEARVIGVKGSNYWVIENTAPTVILTAVDGDGKIAYSNEDLYYKSVAVTATVADLDAGVASLKWIINKDGVESVLEESVAEVDRNEKQTIYNFTHTFTESGSYSVSVVAYDNADNESIPEQVYKFNVDGEGPAIQVTPTNYDDEWATEKTITFTITDTGSGIAWWSLTGPDNQPYPYTVVAGKENTYTFTVTKKGIYTIKAADGAGNTNTCELTFEKVSNEVPATPEVQSDIKAEESGWFTTKPTITITGQETTPDGTAVTNYYRMWKEGEAEPQQAFIVGDSFQIPGEGIYNLRVWAVSESGMQSAEQPVYQLKYDGTAPEIRDLVITGKGTVNQVTFRVAESVSGLANLEAVYNSMYTQPLMFREVSKGVYSANFTAAMTGEYEIRATDVAGNTTTAKAFNPMNIIVTYVSGNAESGIKILGQVLPGTFEIASVEVKYGSFGMGYGYNAEELLVVDEGGNKALTATLTNIEENTIYYFRIIATSTTGEVCEYSGSYKTGILGKSGANVVGTVIDETMYMRRAVTANISVMLYDANDNIVQSINGLGDGDYFMFKGIPDGIYTIRATNGNSSVTQGVIIENGFVVAPEGQLKLILRGGQKTDVEYEEGNSLHFVVDGLTDLFDDSTNFGDKERDVIEQGGIIEFCMTIDELSESEVPASDRTLIAQSLGRQERVLMYVDFSIWKRATFAYGLLWEEQVTAIAGGKSIQIVIPLLSDWVGLKNLSVIRVHGNSVDRLSDLDDNPNTYTISSTLFSTYALVYTDETISTEDDSNGSGGAGNGSQNPNNGTGSGASGSTSDISKTPNSNNNLTSNGSGSTPRTGDEAPILWVSILGLAAGILGSLQLKRRK